MTTRWARSLVTDTSRRHLALQTAGGWPYDLATRRRSRPWVTGLDAGASSDSELGSALDSSWREWISSLVNTLRRCHSTVRGLRKSRAPISGFDSPSRASCAMCRSCGSQIVTRLDRPLAHVLARRQQLPARALGERLHPHRRELVVRGAELGARVDSAMLAAQPLAVEEMRCARDRARSSCGGAARSPPGRGPRRPGPRSAAHATGFDAERPVGPAGRVISVSRSTASARTSAASVRAAASTSSTSDHTAATCRAAWSWLPPPPRARPRQAPEAVVEHRGRPVRRCARCPAARSAARSPLDEGARPRPRGRAMREDQRAVRCERTPIASVMALPPR